MERLLGMNELSRCYRVVDYYIVVIFLLPERNIFELFCFFVARITNVFC